MATFQELGQEYAQRILSNPTRQEATRIASSINGLVYSGTNRLLSAQDKKAIARQIITGFQYYRPGIGWQVRNSDNSNYLDLVDFIIDQIDD